jgi:hypothetical protein
MSNSAELLPNALGTPAAVSLSATTIKQSFCTFPDRESQEKSELRRGLRTPKIKRMRK